MGASIRLTLSPTPPVECLSSTGPSQTRARPVEHLPERVIARVSATVSARVSPLQEDRHRHRGGLAFAPRAVDQPLHEGVDLRAAQRPPSRLLRMISCASMASYGFSKALSVAPCVARSQRPAAEHRLDVVQQAARADAKARRRQRVQRRASSRTGRCRAPHRRRVRMPPEALKPTRPRGLPVVGDRPAASAAPPAAWRWRRLAGAGLEEVGAGVQAQVRGRAISASSASTPVSRMTFSVSPGQALRTASQQARRGAGRRRAARAERQHHVHLLRAGLDDGGGVAQRASMSAPPSGKLATAATRDVRRQCAARERRQARPHAHGGDRPEAAPVRASHRRATSASVSPSFRLVRSRQASAGALPAGRDLRHASCRGVEIDVRGWGWLHARWLATIAGQQSRRALWPRPRPAASVWAWLSVSADKPAAMFVISESASTRMPAWRARMVSGTVLMPTACGAQQLQHADLGRGLELRAQAPGEHAFVQRHAAPLAPPPAPAGAAPGRRRSPC